MAAGTISSSWPWGQTHSHLLSAQQAGVGAALSLNPASLPVLREAQIETEFEMLPDFLVPLGTLILAENSLCLHPPESGTHPG